MSYTRFAIYYVPPQGALAQFGATWLGWDVAAGRAVEPFPIDGIDEVTVTPRKYGFHGTLKPPFRLADGIAQHDLELAVANLAQNCGSAICTGLKLSKIGKFLALIPTGDTKEIARVARCCVEQLDHFRAPPADAELTRRRKASLTPRQEAFLQKWGYPYVADEFRFHLTLTGALDPRALDQWFDKAQSQLPELPQPFEINSVALCGEAKEGRFHLLHRYDLTG